MRRSLTILSLLALTFLFGCGQRNNAVMNANASSNTMTGNEGTGATAGSGPQNQGIGGNTNQGAVNNNTYTVPPGFSKNGDRGSASSTTGNTP